MEGLPFFLTLPTPTALTASNTCFPQQLHTGSNIDQMSAAEYCPKHQELLGEARLPFSFWNLGPTRGSWKGKMWDPRSATLSSHNKLSKM